MIATTLDDYTNDKNMHIFSSPQLTTLTTKIQVYFDGLCQPCNPGGTACFAFVVKNEEGKIIHSEYGLAKYNSTNNVAEYTGIIKALEWLIANNYQNESIIIKGDSRLVIQQIKRKFKVRAPTIIPLYLKAMSLISKFQHIEFEWIPRDQNYEADRLSNLAYQERL